MDHHSTANIGNLDPRITFELSRDFRIHKPNLALPLQFNEWMRWRMKNEGTLDLVEWARTILSENYGTSINSMIRIMQKFSGASKRIQRQAILTLIGNCKFVRAEIKFKHPDLQIDLDNSLLFIQSHEKNSNEAITACYG